MAQICKANTTTEETPGASETTELAPPETPSVCVCTDRVKQITDPPCPQPGMCALTSQEPGWVFGTELCQCSDRIGLQVSRASLDGVWSSQGWWRLPLPVPEGWNEMILQAPSKPNPPVLLWHFFPVQRVRQHANNCLTEGMIH